MFLFLDVKQQKQKCAKQSDPFLCRIKQCPSANTQHSSDGVDIKKDVHMQISSLPYQLDNSHSQDSKMHLICVAQKVENPLALYSNSIKLRSAHQALISADSSKAYTPNTLDFGTRSNTDWVVLACDMSSLNMQSDTLLGKKFTDFVCQADMSRFQTHMDAVKSGDYIEHSSTIYRFRLSVTRHVYLTTNSRMTSLSTNSTDSQIILSKHSIYGECDPNELKGCASASYMKAISSKPHHQVPLGSNLHQQLEIPGLTANGFMPNSPHYQSKSLRHPVGGNPPPYQQQQQQINVDPMTSASVQQHNSSNLNMTMMSGISQLPDVNFNDCYPPRMTYGPSGGSYNMSERGMGWPAGRGAAAGGKGRIHQMKPMRPQGPGTRPRLLSPGIRDPMSTDLTITGLNAGLNGPPLDCKAEGPEDNVLRKLLQAKDDDEYHRYCSGYSIIPPSVSSSVSSSSNSSASRGADTTTQVSPAASVTSMPSGTKPSDHHLLKKLLSDGPPDDCEKFTERPTGLLHKLFNEDDKEGVVLPRKSPPAQSPTTSSSNRSGRHSSGGSITSITDSKNNRVEEGGRGTKRKISTNTSSTNITSTSALSKAEADSTAAALNHTTILNHLLTKPIETSAKQAADPQDITATPLERLKLKLSKSNQPGTVVDVINNTIMLGAEQIDRHRFVSIPRTSNPKPAASSSSSSSSSMYHRQSVPNYVNSGTYDTQHVPHSMESTLSTMQNPVNSNMMGNCNNIDTKDYYSLLGGPPTELTRPPQQSNMRNNPPPMGFQQNLKSEHDMLSPNLGPSGGPINGLNEASNGPVNGPAGEASNSSGSMLEQLLSMSNDPDGVIQELEILLGGDTCTVMNITSPEDEMAIKDIENELLNSVGNLTGSSVPYTPVILAPTATSNGRPDSCSPVQNIGLQDLPASASNPAQSATFNISYRPPISNTHMSSYSGMSSQSNPQLQHSLRTQLQQGTLTSRGSTQSIRANHRAAVRQGSGPGRSMPHSLNEKMRHHSENSPASMMPPFSLLSNGNYTLPSNFNEMMKSTPPNLKLPQDLNSTSFAHGSPADMMHSDMSPHNSRVPQNFPQSPMDVPCSPQHFHFPDQYTVPRPMLQRQQMLRPMGGQQQYADQVNLHQQQLMGSGLHSPQGVRSTPVSSTPMDTLPTLPPPPGQSNLQHQHQQQQYNQLEQVSNNSVSSHQYIRQEMRAKINARNPQHNTSPQHHQSFVSQPQTMTSHSQQHMSMMSPPPTPVSAGSHRQTLISDPLSSVQSTSAGGSDPLADFEDSVLPDEILNQITELTNTQNEIEQQQKMNTMKNSNNFGDNMMLTNERDLVRQKIDQSKKDSSQVLAQLRAWSGPSSQPDGTLVNLFRNQLATNPSLVPKSKSGSKSTEPMEIEKLKHSVQNSNVNIISLTPHPPVVEIQPNDQSGSLLQKLLTDGAMLP